MEKQILELPDDWEEITANANERPRPIPATYICRIIDARIAKDSYGKKRLEVELDIDEGDFKDYFSDDFEAMKSRHPETAFWRLTSFIRLDFNDPKNGHFFKQLLRRFTDAIEFSNPDFTVVKNCDIKTLVGKVLGALIYVKEKKSDNGDRIYWNYRVDRVYSVRDVRAGIKLKPSWIEDENGIKRDPNAPKPEPPKHDSETVEDVDIPF